MDFPDIGNLFVGSDLSIYLRETVWAPTETDAGRVCLRKATPLCKRWSLNHNLLFGAKNDGAARVMEKPAPGCSKL
jgi:hypothetical protein